MRVETVRRMYSEDEKQRALELAKNAGVRGASYILDIPATTIYKWQSRAQNDVPALPSPTVATAEAASVDDNRVYVTEKLWAATNEAVNELRKMLVDLKSAVELLTETLVGAAETANTTTLVINPETHNHWHGEDR